jgi:hypothetical protein
VSAWATRPEQALEFITENCEDIKQKALPTWAPPAAQSGGI